MTKTMRILTLLAVMMFTAGQAWADEPPVQFGHITYNNDATGGTLKFYGENCSYWIDFNDGTSERLTSKMLDPIHEDPEDKASVIIGYRFYIRAIPNVGRKLVAPDADGNVSFIRAELVSTGSGAQQAPRRSPGNETFTTGQTLPVKFKNYDYENKYNFDTNAYEYSYFGQYYVDMPANPDLSVSITATFPEQATTTVSYIDPTKTGEAQNCTVTAYVLDGTEGRIGYRDTDNSRVETWYVCNSNLSYINSLNILGTVNLILADGSTMTVGSANNPTSASAIYAQSDNVNFYGQSEGTGSLDVYGNIGIWANEITINGGRISATGSTEFGIYSSNSVTINGGQVTANGAQWGIYACGGATLGWTNSTDFIKANKYYVNPGYTVKTAEGKPMRAYTPASQNESEKLAVLIQGNTTLNASVIADKVLRPATDADVSLTYRDWDTTEKELVSYTTGTDTDTNNDVVYVLQSTESLSTTLGVADTETWYVVTNSNTDESVDGGLDVKYRGGNEVSSTIQLQGDVHLILADGATMEVENNLGTAISTSGAMLTVYGQGGQTEGALTVRAFGSGIFQEYGDSKGTTTINGGQVTIVGTDNEGIANGLAGGDVIINGGTVNINGATSSAISVDNVTINGGTVKANVENITNGDGISATNVTINGGQVTANGAQWGIHSNNGDITLGWTNPTDFIKASNYFVDVNRAVKTVDGKALKYTDSGDNTVKVMGTVSNVETIAGQTLTPYGYGGYCGQDDTETTNVDESKTLTWEIPLVDDDNDTDTPMTLSTTMTILGTGTMVSYSTEAPAPWSDKAIEAANILASADVANVNAIAENIPVTLGYTGPVATTHTFNGYFVRKTTDNTNISATVLSHNDQTDVWTLTMPDYAVNVSPKLTRNTTVSVEVVNANGIVAGDDANVTVTVDPVTAEGENNVPDVSGIATISVQKEGESAKPYNVAVVDGTGKFNVTNMENASFTINAAFAANDQWSASTTAAPVEFDVPKITTSLGISLDKSSIYVGETAKVSITLNQSINALVTLKFTDKEEYYNDPQHNFTVALATGNGSFDLTGLAAGTYKVSVVYSGDDKYVGDNKTLSLTVSKRETSVSVSTNSPVIAK